VLGGGAGNNEVRAFIVGIECRGLTPVDTASRTSTVPASAAIT
jgi:hypothetical protein